MLRFLYKLLVGEAPERLNHVAYIHDRIDKVIQEVRALDRSLPSTWKKQGEDDES